MQAPQLQPMMEKWEHTSRFWSAEEEWVGILALLLPPTAPTPWLLWYLCHCCDYLWMLSVSLCFFGSTSGEDGGRAKYSAAPSTFGVGHRGKWALPSCCIQVRRKETPNSCSFSSCKFRAPRQACHSASVDAWRDHLLCRASVHLLFWHTKPCARSWQKEIVWEQGIQVTDQVWALRTRLVSDGSLLSGSMIKFQGHIFFSYMKIDCFSQYLDKCRPVWLFQRKLLHLALSFKSSLWPSHHHPVCFQDEGENTDCVFMAEFSCYKKDKTLTKSKVGFEIFYDSTVRNFYIPYKESNHFLLIVAQSVFPKRLININMIKINNNNKKEKSSDVARPVSISSVIRF